MFRRPLLALSLLVLARPALAVRTRVGEVTALAGRATALFSGEAPRQLEPAAPILMDDLLTTGAAARLACRIEGGIALQLGENAALRVTMAALRGPRPGVAVRGFGGAVLMDIPPQPRGSAVGLTMPWAHIGVRGTRFFAGESAGTHAVFVARGEVEVVAPGGRAVVAAGDGVDVVAGVPTTPVRWGEARISAALASVGVPTGSQ
jgi:ferric-dicitrate binding protein FerR (iron transport regulator)